MSLHKIGQKVHTWEDKRLCDPFHNQVGTIKDVVTDNRTGEDIYWVEFDEPVMTPIGEVNGLWLSNDYLGY